MELVISRTGTEPKIDPQTDLLARCRAGDWNAWRELYDRHFPFIFRIARQLGCPPDEVEDVTQEVFAAAHRRLDTFSYGEFESWLFRICANVVADHHRRRAVRRAFARWFGGRPEARTAPIDATPEAQLVQSQARQQVAVILAKMDPKKREVFMLYELEGLSGEEIARRVGRSVDTVWSRLFHARKEFARIGRRLRMLDGPRGER